MELLESKRKYIKYKRLYLNLKNRYMSGGSFLSATEQLQGLDNLARVNDGVTHQSTLQATTDQFQKSKENAMKEYETSLKNEQWKKNPHLKLDGEQAREDDSTWDQIYYRGKDWYHPIKGLALDSKPFYSSYTSSHEDQFPRSTSIIERLKNSNKDKAKIDTLFKKFIKNIVYNGIDNPQNFNEDSIYFKQINEIGLKYYNAFKDLERVEDDQCVSSYKEWVGKDLKITDVRPGIGVLGYFKLQKLCSPQSGKLFNLIHTPVVTYSKHGLKCRANQIGCEIRKHVANDVAPEEEEEEEEE
jgi:hypothetical protein